MTGERGQDPREAVLLAFGGAGPLFATLLAHELGMKRVVVPPHAGNFSAWGLLGQDLVRSSASTSVASLTEDGLASASRDLLRLFERLAARSSALGPDQQYEAALDMRYTGQEYTLTIPVQFDATRGVIEGEPTSTARAFGEEYQRVFGHALDDPVEIVSVRATVRTPLPRGKRRPAASDGADGQIPTGRTVRAWSFTRGEHADFALVDRGSPRSRIDAPRTGDRTGGDDHHLRRRRVRSRRPSDRCAADLEPRAGRGQIPGRSGSGRELRAALPRRIPS